MFLIPKEYKKGRRDVEEFAATPVKQKNDQGSQMEETREQPPAPPEILKVPTWGHQYQNQLTNIKFEIFGKRVVLGELISELFVQC